MTAAPQGADTEPDAAPDRGFQQAPCGLAVLDHDARILRANAMLAELSGLSLDELVGRPFPSLLDGGGRAYWGTQFQDDLFERGSLREVAFRVLRPDGTGVPVLVNADRDAGPGTAAQVRVAVFEAAKRQSFERDLLSAKREAEESERNVRTLQLAATRFLAAQTRVELAVVIGEVVRDAFLAQRSVVVEYDDDGTSYAILDGDDAADLLAAARRSRPAGSRALGPDEVMLVPDLDDAYARSEELGDAFRALRAAAMSSLPIVGGETVLGAIVCLYGRPRTLEPQAIELQRAIARQAGLALSRVRLVERLETMASIDPLTGLANRAAVDAAAEAAVARAREQGERVCLIFLDLDGFKQVNDELGHRAGDLVLRAVAGRIRAAVRPGDIVGRFGGDEFVVICAGIGLAETTRIAEAIRAAADEPVEGLDASVRVTASFGVALADGDESAESLTRRADDAMYEAKRSRRAGIVVVG